MYIHVHFAFRDMVCCFRCDQNIFVDYFHNFYDLQAQYLVHGLQADCFAQFKQSQYIISSSIFGIFLWPRLRHVFMYAHNVVIDVILPVYVQCHKIIENIFLYS